MPRSILITGVSGSGKSAVCLELKRRGYKAYDIERIRPLFRMVHKRTGKTVRVWDNSDLGLIKQMDWVCDRGMLERFMRSNTRGTVFYCGTASNLEDLRPLFNQVILLKPSRKVLQRRLATRTTNDFARDPRVRQWLLGWKDEWEDRLRQEGATIINANQSVKRTTDDVLREAQ